MELAPAGDFSVGFVESSKKKRKLQQTEPSTFSKGPILMEDGPVKLQLNSQKTFLDAGSTEGRKVNSSSTKWKTQAREKVHTSSQTFNVQDDRKVDDFSNKTTVEEAGLTLPPG